MKAKKLTALLICLMTAFVLFAFSASAEEIVHCNCGEENYQWVKTDQTCTKDGKYERICTVCKKVFITEVIPAHNFKVIYTGKTATCTENGYDTVYCDWCNTIENRETEDKNNHLFGEWIVTKEPTCKDEGEKERKCTRTGCTYVEKGVVPADSSKHNEGDNGWETVTEVSCSQEGKEKSLCCICNEVFTRTVPVHSDYATNTEKYKEVEIKEANCTQAASVKYQCRDCGVSFTITGERDYNKHDYTDESLWYYSDGASCKNHGKVTKYCKNSRTHKIEEDYAPHIFEGVETVTKEPACKKENGETIFTDGEKTIKCIYCDEVKTETVSAGTHSFGDWVITGTCAEGGTATRTCTCGDETENITFEANTHLNYNSYTVAPTCIYRGYKHAECKVCHTQFYIFPEELAAKGEHTPGKWVVTEEATCTESGEKELHCDICDEVIDKAVVLQREHSCIILNNGYAATCKEAGITDLLYCVLCETTFEQEIIPALGHDFVEQFTPEEGAKRICDRCNEYEIIGDNGETVTCKCLCHNSNGLAKFIYKIIVVFSKLLNINQECNCGIAHY